MPEATKARIDGAQSGVAYLLVDGQYRMRPDGHDDWFRSATKIVNRSGLEGAGTIEISYNPAFESVGVNFLRLIRDGKVIDLTRETQFRVVEREAELNDGIISGRLKAVANLRDVRVGDIVDYATTLHTTTVLWPNQSFYHFTQRYSDAVALNSLRLVWPAGMAPQYKTINSDIVFGKREDHGSTEWEWTAQDQPGLKSEEDVPATVFQWGRVDVSTMRSWAELARWAVAHYQGDDALTDDFTARLDAIAKASTSPGYRLTEAVRYVQDNIRYVGEELGEGSYVPRRPKTVLTRGYGDCKDKSLLLAVALRRLGIDAVPALVSTVAGERLPDRLPSPLEFDHVIVRAVLDGKVMWIDATASHQGGRGAAIVQSDLGYALPIRAEQAALEPIKGFAERAGRYTVLERFDIDEAAEVPLTLHVETRYTDARADRMRAYWASNSAKKIADSNLDFYHRRFAGLAESKPLELKDDRDGNTLIMVENYTMPRAAYTTAKLSSKLTTRAYALLEVLPSRQAGPRVQPLALSRNFANEQTIELNVKDRALGGLEDLDVKQGTIKFSRRSTQTPTGLRINYVLNTGSDRIAPAADAEAVYTLSDQVADEAALEFHLDKASRASPDGIEVAAWTPIKSDMEKITALIQKSDETSLLAALSLLGEVSGKVAHPSPVAGLIDGMKGAVLAGLRRHQAALAALQSSAAQYGGNPGILNLWIGYELDLGDAAAVARAMQRTAKLQPAVLGAIERRWVEAAMSKVQALPADKRLAVRQDICIALTEAGWQQQPRTSYGDYLLGCAIEAHSLRGQLADARALLAKSPPTDILLTLAIDRRHQALWPEIDRLRGDGLRKNLEREVQSAAAAAKAAPTSYDAVSRQMQALRALGDFKAAIAAGSPLAGSKSQLEVGGNEAFWLVNELASNLQAAGRTDEAVAALDNVLAFGLDRYPELVSLAINRTETLNAAGRYKESIDALADLEDRHDKSYSGYGGMWIWANRSCALRKLGRDAEAQPIEAKVSAKPADNWSAATFAAACRNDTEAVADLLVKRMRDPEARSAALGLFIDFMAPEAHTPFDVALRGSMAKARQMPSVQAEFAKWGRSVRFAGTAKGWNDY